jgi:hypothetical protein
MSEARGKPITHKEVEGWFRVGLKAAMFMENNYEIFPKVWKNLI